MAEKEAHPDWKYCAAINDFCPHKGNVFKCSHNECPKGNNNK